MGSRHPYIGKGRLVLLAFLMSALWFTQGYTDTSPSDQGSIGCPSYVITATAGPGGSISPSGSVSVNSGANQSFSIAANPGYHITDVVVDNVSKGAVTSYKFTDVTGPHTIAASFAINTFTINASAGSGGSISPSGAVTVNYGSTPTFTITPNTGYHIVDVLVDNVSKGAVTSYQFPSISAGHTIAATFAINTYTITASAGANGAISGPPNPVNYGDTPTFTITPDPGYHVVDVSVDGVGSVGAVTSYTFPKVTTNRTISATFAINTYTITATAGANGAISGPATVNYGDTPTFTITPDPGYHVVDVSVDGVGSVGAVTSYTFPKVTTNRTISATFAINTYTITATAGANGAISGPATVNYGDTPTFTITPDPGYHVVDVSVDGVGSVGAVTSYTFPKVTTNRTISATFAINTFTITATAVGHGTISGPPNPVNYGDTPTFTITPDPGYHVVDVSVDGVGSVGAVTSYTFPKVTANRTISATFAPNPVITATAGTHGTISPSGAIQVTYGGSQGFLIKPDLNYSVKSVLVDGLPVGPLASYTFNSVITDRSISALFIANTIRILADRSTVKVPPGGAATFQVKLSDNPYANATVSVAWQSGNQAITVPNGATLAFTQDNWDTYQKVTLAASTAFMDAPKAAIIQGSSPGMTPCQVTAIRTYIDINPFIHLLLTD